MMLDAQARQDLFQHLVDQGYTGTFDALWQQVAALSFAARLRVYRSIQVHAVRQDSPEAAAFLERVLALAPAHFDDARPDDLAFGYGITLNRSSDRRRAERQHPLRLGGLRLDVERRDGADRITIHCLMYVNNEFRRDKYYVFPTKKSRRTSR